MDDVTRREWLVASVTFVGMTAAIASYIFFFGALEPGGPKSWGEFGDFFGGVVNPIVGLATVVLVVRTLQVTRQEAASQRDLLNTQIEQLGRQNILAEHQKRLDGLLSSWNTLMQTKLWISRGDQAGLLGQLHDRPLGEAFADPNLLMAADLRESGTPPTDTYPTDAALGPVFAMLKEFAEYTSDYDAASRTKVLTNYYRRRVGTTAFILNAYQLLDDNVTEELFLDT